LVRQKWLLVVEQEEGLIIGCIVAPHHAGRQSKSVDWGCGGHVQWRILARKRSREGFIVHLLSLLGFVHFGIQTIAIETRIMLS
jgi:hypothetical protein